MSTRRPFRPQFVELEDRTTPAMWAVKLVGPAEGTVGSTAAEHIGRLRINPNLPTAADGAAVVEAATAEDAIRSGLFGSVAVRVAGRTTFYSYSADTASKAVADQRPFVVDAKGHRGTVALEDLARLPELGVDWDYNDRTWQVDVRQYNGPPLGGGISTLSDPAGTVVGEWVNEWVSPQGETAMVTTTVTYDKSGYEGLYYWNYHFFNYNFGTSLGPDYNLEHIFLGIDTNLTADDFIEIKNEDGLPGEFVPDAGQIGTIGHVRWTAPTPGGLDPNEEGSVWFTTQPMKIAGAVGEMWDDSAASTGGGYAKQPDCGCDQNTPAQVTKTGWTHWQQTPMGQVRGEKFAATPDWSEPEPGVRRMPGPPVAPLSNIGEEGGYYRTIDEWKQFTLTIEFRFAPEPSRVRPNTPNGLKPISNQDFGNSGVYIHDRYEVQIIDPSRFDSVNDPPTGVPYEGTVNNDPRDAQMNNRNKQIPGGLYGVDHPRGEYKNWSKPATDWNSLTIVYCPPTIVNGVITKAARLTTILNGNTIWDNEEIKDANGPLRGTGARGNATPVDRGHVYLQSHWGNQVDFRNPVIKGLLAGG